MKILPVVLMLALLISCATNSPPAWKTKSYRHLEDYKTQFLSGNTGSAEAHYAKALREASAGNDLAILSVVYLTRYALFVASLEDFVSADFEKIQTLEPNEANGAYLLFLKGEFSKINDAALPARYRGVLKAALSLDASAAFRELSAMDDPLSLLIACGVWTRHCSADDRILQLAISTASAHGWRRPLWAFLEKQKEVYREQGQKDKAAAIDMRLNAIKK